MVLDVDGNCISSIANKIKSSRKSVKKCYIIVRDNLEIKSNNVWNGKLLSPIEICIKVTESLTWNQVKAKVKYITKQYKKSVAYSKEEMRENI